MLIVRWTWDIVPPIWLASIGPKTVFRVAIGGLLSTLSRCSAPARGAVLTASLPKRQGGGLPGRERAGASPHSAPPRRKVLPAWLPTLHWETPPTRWPYRRAGRA